MKNLRKAELAVIGLTILCLVFTAGYFVGRGSGAPVISFDAPPRDSVPAFSGPAPATGASPASSDPAAAPVTAGTNVATPAPSTLAPSASAAATGAVITGKVNINTASLSALDALPGIGKVIAQSIIDYREKIGGFKTIEQIKEVDGIGDKKFDAMKNMITVG